MTMESFMLALGDTLGRRVAGGSVFFVPGDRVAPGGPGRGVDARDREAHGRAGKWGTGKKRTAVAGGRTSRRTSAGSISIRRCGRFCHSPASARWRVTLGPNIMDC